MRRDKIVLEEHFAIDLTIADSQVHARPEVRAGLKSDRRKIIGRDNARKLFGPP